MTERKGQSDPNETPEDVATLYSWANLHGAKYRDFSASRAQTREKARQRVEQAIEEERGRVRQEAEVQRMAEAARNAESAHIEASRAEAEHIAEAARIARLQAQQAEEARRAEHAAQQAHAVQQAALEAQQELARRVAQQSAQDTSLTSTPSQSSWRQPPRPESRPEFRSESRPEPRPDFRPQSPFVQPPTAPHFVPPPAPQAAPPQTTQHFENRPEPRPEPRREVRPESRVEPRPEFRPEPRFEPRPDTRPESRPETGPEPRFDRFTAPPPPPAQQASPASSYAAAPPPRQQAAPQFPMREESYTSPAPPRPAAESRDPYGRPAWLTPEHAEPAAQPIPPTPDDTLQGTRERLATRWYALQAIYDGGAQPAQSTVPAPTPARAPVMAVFSLAGGVGKTSLLATLARALSARGERVLLVDTAAYGLMPFFFGARDQRPGMLRTFSPPMASGDAPIQMITLDPDGLAGEPNAQEPLTTEITTHARGVGRVLIDLATASGAITRRVLRLTPQVLVPLVPDMSSVVSVSSIDAFFQRNSATSGKPALPHYVLNQFDSSLPLHLDVREVLREQLGERLLPFTLRYAPAVSEALAEGMTVMDYAPNSGIAEDFLTLAAWVKSLSAPAITGFRGVRWSER